MTEEIFSDNIIKAVFSKPKSKTAEYKKITVRRIGNDSFHLEKFTQTQVFHENIPAESMQSRAEELMQGEYMQLDAWSTENKYSLMISKKGKHTLLKSKNQNHIEVSAQQNKKKNYIIKENDFIPPLVDLGVFTKDGRIVRSMYDKFRQINRFVELVDDCIKDSGFSEMNILDFGCGKSYLTFILYHYLVNIKGINAHITGLDLKKTVIENCSELAKKYGYDGLNFEVGNINGYRFPQKPDMVITLHACDTATDFALFNAIKNDCKIILSVPCCQHELCGQMKTENFGILSDYGIIKERFAALATDSIRAKLLTACGYGVQVVEFIDMAHSPKNILIRAVKKNISDKKRKTALDEVTRLCAEFGFKPKLLQLLTEDKTNELFTAL